MRQSLPCSGAQYAYPWIRGLGPLPGDFAEAGMRAHRAKQPRTHKICDIKNFWIKCWLNLTILVSLES